VVVLERESYDAQKARGDAQCDPRIFSSSTSICLDAINPKAWEGLDLNKEPDQGAQHRGRFARGICAIMPKISAEKEEGSLGRCDGAGRRLPSGFRGGGRQGFHVIGSRQASLSRLPICAVGIILLVVLVAVFNHS